MGHAIIISMGPLWIRLQLATLWLSTDRWVLQYTACVRLGPGSGLRCDSSVSPEIGFPISLRMVSQSFRSVAFFIPTPYSSIQSDTKDLDRAPLTSLAVTKKDLPANSFSLDRLLTCKKPLQHPTTYQTKSEWTLGNHSDRKKMLCNFNVFLHPRYLPTMWFVWFGKGIGES